MTDDLAEAKRHIDALIGTVRWMADNFGNFARPLSCVDAQAFLDRPDAEGQRVEGGDEDQRKWLVWYHDPDMPPELIVRGGNAEEVARKRHADQLNAWSCHLFREVFPGEQVASGAELTRLKSSQAEHDRTVREKALEEALNRIAVLWSGWVDAHGESIYGTREDFLLEGRCHASGDLHAAIRSLIDQTGQESGT